MRKEYPPDNITVNTSPVAVTEVPATEVNGISLIDFNIPAGKGKVIIENRGPENNGTPATATINGDNLAIGARWEISAFLDPVVNQWKSSPAISVVTNGTAIWYQYYE